MLKKRKFISISIIVLFLIIASATTFRIAIYAFIICYIGVLIAKSKNKRLKVPVLDFFAFTFTFGIVLGCIYSFSPKIQYYEFLLSHSRWEIHQVTDLENHSISEINVIDHVNIGAKTKLDLIYLSEGKKKRLHLTKYLYEDDLFKIVKQTSNLTESIQNVTLKDQNFSKITIFKKLDKANYHVFSKDKLIGNSYSVSNFIFACFFLLLFIVLFLFVIFNLKKIISTILNQFPKQKVIFYTAILSYIVIYLVVVLS
nr:hypothetical protein [uncultured Flavobacterium sp.]